MWIETIVISVIGLSFIRWLTSPTRLWKTSAIQQPRTLSPSNNGVIGNYPPPLDKPSGTPPPSNISFLDDRWLDWIAIIGLFIGLMYAVWLGSTPNGKWQQ